MVSLKNIVISLVRTYQRIAPDRLRACCRFEPSCSNYMILSVKKYGATNGVKKGISRILRCRPPFGGIDKPWNKDW